MTHLESGHRLIQPVEELHGDIHRREKELRGHNEEHPSIIVDECGHK
jgi:hypothetical protein